MLLLNCLCGLHFSKELSIALRVMRVEIAKVILVFVVIVILVGIAVLLLFSIVLICLIIICGILVCTTVSGVPLLVLMDCALVRFAST